MNEQIKKLYIGEVNCNPDAGCLAIVACSSKEAREIFRQSGIMDSCDCGRNFICAKVHLDKTINVKNLPIGELEIVEGCKLGAYSGCWGAGTECEVCGEEGDESSPTYYEHGAMLCAKCETNYVKIKNL